MGNLGTRGWPIAAPVHAKTGLPLTQAWWGTRASWSRSERSCAARRAQQGVGGRGKRAQTGRGAHPAASATCTLAKSAGTILRGHLHLHRPPAPSAAVQQAVLRGAGGGPGSRPNTRTPPPICCTRPPPSRARRCAPSARLPLAPTPWTTRTSLRCRTTSWPSAWARAPPPLASLGCWRTASLSSRSPTRARCGSTSGACQLLPPPPRCTRLPSCCLRALTLCAARRWSSRACPRRARRSAAACCRWRWWAGGLRG